MASLNWTALKSQGILKMDYLSSLIMKQSLNRQKGLRYLFIPGDFTSSIYGSIVDINVCLRVQKGLWGLTNAFVQFMRELGLRVRLIYLKLLFNSTYSNSNFIFLLSPKKLK